MKILRHGEEAPILRALFSRVLGRTAALVGRVSNEALTADRSHRYQFAVLATLDAFGPASQSQLCRRTDLDRSDMNTALNALEREGCVERATDPTDRRVNIVQLTGHGHSRFGNLSDQVQRAQAHILAPLSPEERQELVRLVCIVHDHLAPEATNPEAEGSASM